MRISILRSRFAPWCFIIAFFAAWAVRLATFGLVDVHIQNLFLKRVLSDGWRALVWLVFPICWLVGSGAMGPLSLLTASIRRFVFGLVMSGLVTLEGGPVLAVLVHSFNDLWGGLFF